MSQEVHMLLKRAASLEGRSLSDFVGAALSAARKTVEQNDIIRLSVNDQELFAKSID